MSAILAHLADVLARGADACLSAVRVNQKGNDARQAGQ
jgi:hypothetical protein